MIADSLFVNASVFVADGSLGPPDTVAVRGGVITYVGRGVPEDFVGPRTEIIDAAGASLLPGFIDAHVHPVAAGMQALRCDLSRLPHDRAAYLDAIGRLRAHASRRAGDQWRRLVWRRIPRRLSNPP